VLDSKGHILYRHKPVRTTAVNRGTVDALHRMLRAAVTDGTGRAAASGCAPRLGWTFFASLALG
jgi:membrane peptidoglycan carboxypeptidase